MKKVKWLLAGAGDIATRRAGPALVDTANSEIVAVCDLIQDRAGKLAEKLNVNTIFTDYSEALAKSECDAVYIATPQCVHIDMCLKALKAEKHFLCEKPLGLNGAECLTLFEAAKKSDRITSCSNYRRLSEQYKITENLLNRHEIGQLTGGWGIYSTGFYNPGNQPISKAVGISRIKELGFYLIDIIQNFFGMPCEAMAQAGIINKDIMNDVEDITTVILKFPGDQLFSIIFNTTSVGTRHEMEFFGSEGRIYWQEWPPHGNGPVIKITKTGTEYIEAHTDQNFHLPMIEDYVDALINGRQPVCTLESAVKTEIITDAIFRSIESAKSEIIDWGSLC